MGRTVISRFLVVFLERRSQLCLSEQCISFLYISPSVCSFGSGLSIKTEATLKRLCLSARHNHWIYIKLHSRVAVVSLPHPILLSPYIQARICVLLFYYALLQSLSPNSWKMQFPYCNIHNLKHIFSSLCRINPVLKYYDNPRHGFRAFLHVQLHLKGSSQAKTAPPKT